MPRIYELVRDVAVVVDNDLTLDALRASVDAYQRVEPLRLAELWALPIMVRLVAIERLAARAQELLRVRATDREAEAWAEAATGALESDPAAGARVQAEPGMSLRRWITWRRWCGTSATGPSSRCCARGWSASSRPTA